METSKLKKFAQFARRSLIDQVPGKMQQVLAEDSAARREEPKAVEDLATQIKTHGRDQVIETVAYTWFNRFCALRFMDVNRFTRIGVVSPAEGQFQPEILAEAKMGHIDEEMAPEKTRQQIFALLNGTTSSRDPQAEAYRLLVVAACNDYNKVAPNICVLENIHFEDDKLKDYMDFIGWDLFTAPLQTTLRQFEEADNFGSLIRPKVTDVNSMLKILEAKNVSGQLFLSKTHKKVLHTLRQANYLSPKYHVVIANPPYMGGKVKSP